jgi:hypothetical protein
MGLSILLIIIVAIVCTGMRKEWKRVREYDEYLANWKSLYTDDDLFPLTYDEWVDGKYNEH